MSTRPPLPREAGIAIVLVLWLIVVLSLQVGVFNRSTHDGLRLVENAAAVARGQALLHAGIEYAVARMTLGDVRARWQADGGPRDLEIGGVALRLMISDENGRINLNLADPALIEGLMRALGLAPAEATQLTDRIVDWRDVDQEKRRRGAEDADYKRAGLDYGAADQPFIDASDLIRVLGLPREVAVAMLPHVTVHTAVGRINPRLASEAVLRALPGIGRQTVEQAVLLLRSGGQRAQSGEALLAPAAAHIASNRGPAYRMRVQLRNAGRSAIGNGEAIVALGLDSAKPYRTLSWRFTTSTAEPPEASGR